MAQSDNERIRILYINQSVDIGGIENLILELIRAQDPARFKPMVCVFEQNGFLEKEFKAAGAEVFVVKKRAGLDVTLCFRLASVIKKSGADLLHTHNQSSWLYTVLANLLMRKPLLHTMHSSCGQNPSRAVRWRKIEWALSLFTGRIVSVAASIADYMVERQGISKAKVQVIHNGVKTHLYRKNSDRALLRASLSLPAKGYVIGNVARLNPIKDQATLMAAFAEEAQSIPEAHLVLVGDGPLRESLTQSAEKLGIASKVRFLGNRRDVPDLLMAMDLFILSSLREGFPIAILEALASGVPVIATRVDGCTEVVRDGVNGLLVPPSNSAALAEAIRYCHGNRARAVEMADNGRRLVESEFTFQTMIQKYFLNYADLTKGR